MKKLPIGLSDFKNLIENNYYYVDKSLFVKELYEAAGEVILIPRPRRFGKTLNLSMLKYFFGKSDTDNCHLFKDTNIWKEQNYRELQGQFPEIYLTFKDVKESNWENAYYKIRDIIAKEFEHYLAPLGDKLQLHQLKEYMDIITKNADEATYSRSLLDLTGILSHYYHKRVIVLLDEYDTPIHSGYAYGYYNEITQFISSLY